MLERLVKRGESSGRVDDNAVSIKKRFKTFRETSLEVIKYYEDLGKVERILCSDSIEEVYQDTRKVIYKFNLA